VRIVFFGTSAFAARVLSFLIERGDHVVAVVTRPDRPKGRSLTLSSPPVKEVAIQLDPLLHIHQPLKASTSEFAEILKTYHADVFVVVAYGEIIKHNILEIPKRGCINIHASLLPKYRGAAPMQRALMDGVSKTGITIIEMVLKMDAGDILEMAELPVSADMTYGELEEKLFPLACECLIKVLQDIKQSAVKRKHQEHSLVTFAAKITTDEAKIDWSLPAQTIHNLVRALSPAPGAWCWVEIGRERKRLKIIRSALAQAQLSDGVNDTIGSLLPDGIIVCGQGVLKILILQLEGKKAMSAEEFLRGYSHPHLNLS
jgi:methionyl-tRNA formyltransferase